MTNVLPTIGEQLRKTRRERGLNQAQIAMRIGRDRVRVSEFERDLRANRMGRDRLTLLADICDTLDLVPVLVPKWQATEIRRMVDDSAAESPRSHSVPGAFDELFVDLDDDGPF